MIHDLIAAYGTSWNFFLIALTGIFVFVTVVSTATGAWGKPRSD